MAYIVMARGSAQKKKKAGVNAGIVFFGYTSAIRVRITGQKDKLLPVLSSRSGVSTGGTYFSKALAGIGAYSLWHISHGAY